MFQPKLHPLWREVGARLYVEQRLYLLEQLGSFNTVVSLEATNGFGQRFTVTKRSAITAQEPTQ